MAVKKKTGKKKVKRNGFKIPQLQEVGVVTHYYPHLGVAIITLKQALHVGEIIQIGGGKQQRVLSMQVDHTPITAAKKKQVVGLKVAQPVKEKEIVFTVI